MSDWTNAENYMLMHSYLNTFGHELVKRSEEGRSNISVAIDIAERERRNGRSEYDYVLFLLRKNERRAFKAFKET